MKLTFAAIIAAKLWEEADGNGSDLGGGAPVVIIDNSGDPEPEVIQEPEVIVPRETMDLAPIQSQLDTIVSLLSSLAANVNETRLEIMRIQGENFAAITQGIENGHSQIAESIGSRIAGLKEELATAAQTTEPPAVGDGSEPTKPKKRWV